jgi:uncharacterized membrane protein
MRIASAGHAILAATMIALGLAGLVSPDFAAVWNGAPERMPGREVLAYFCASISLACGVGLFWRRTAAVAARTLLVSLLLWLLVIKAPVIARHPLEEVAYQSSGESAVMAAGVWVLYAWLATDWDRRRLGFAVGENGLRIARILFGVSLLAFGLSHFFYLDLTAPLVPTWLPAPTAWAYFTGGAYCAAGVAMLTGVLARLAATLVALQIGLITLLVWGPPVAAGGLNGFRAQEAAVSWALTATAWVVAESYRGWPWLGLGRRWRRAAVRSDALPGSEGAR